ncbi:MAG TPA: DNA polymerase III subunit gamma/tau, partial [Dehalococcoidia bacterium]|nr:DNA polymerase III subunit gamma/tau [Dehalococcoidia bacterium]
SLSLPATTTTQPEPPAETLPPDRPLKTPGSPAVKARPSSTPPPKAANTSLTSQQLGSEIERLQLNWKQLIAQAPEETQKTPAVAILRSAGVKPVAIENDTVVLAFKYPIHKEKMEKPENQHVVEQIISNFLGHPCHVSCTHEPEDNHLLRAALKMGAQITDTEEK